MNQLAIYRPKSWQDTDFSGDGWSFMDYFMDLVKNEKGFVCNSIMNII